jgi:hypothetical protein
MREYCIHKLQSKMLYLKRSIYRPSAGGSHLLS